jgi:aspartyl-tRNA(Asn)/glutamyl-tRNA(Gln) amidotransferase subunit A
VLENTSLAGKKIGVPAEYFVEGLDAGVRASIDKAIEHIKSLGGEIVPVSLPHTKYGVSVYYIIMAAEVSTNMARYDGIRFGHKE